MIPILMNSMTLSMRKRLHQHKWITLAILHMCLCQLHLKIVKYYFSQSCLLNRSWKLYQIFPNIILLQHITCQQRLSMERIMHFSIDTYYLFVGWAILFTKMDMFVFHVVCLVPSTKLCAQTISQLDQVK